MARDLAVLAVLTGLFAAADADAGPAGGGRGGGIGTRELAPPFRWFDTKGAALAAAARTDPALPVMCFLRRAGGAADRQCTYAIFSRYDISMSSRTDFAAFRANADGEDGKALALRYGLKQDGALLWFDARGNCVSRSDGPIKVNTITGAVQQWGAVLGRFEREVSKCVREARGHLERERYASAIRSLEPVIDLRGPPGEGVREVLGAIEKRATALVDMADRVEHGRGGRERILAAIAEEFRGTSAGARAKEMAEAEAAREPGPDSTEPAEVGAGADVEPRPSDTPPRPPAPAPEAPEPSIETMLGEVEGEPALEGGRASTAPASAPAAAGAEARGPDELVSAARERQAEAAQLRRNGDDAGTFKALTDALDLGVKALEQRPGHFVTKRYVDDVARDRYECFKALVK